MSVKTIHSTDTTIACTECGTDTSHRVLFNHANMQLDVPGTLIYCTICGVAYDAVKLLTVERLQELWKLLLENYRQLYQQHN